MIEVEGLVKKYAAKEVLSIDHLVIPKGECFGLVGNNGAGKTTLFSLLLDLISPTKGYITSQGIRVDQSEQWKKFTSAFIDDSFVIGYLTPEEFFAFIAELRGVSKEQLAKDIDLFNALFNNEILGQKKYIRDLSKGNQKKVGIAAAFIGSPALIILDEPFANLDPTTQIRLKNFIRETHLKSDTTILISSHDLTHITEVSERIVVLDSGKVVNDSVVTAATLSELEQYFSV